MRKFLTATMALALVAGGATAAYAETSTQKTEQKIEKAATQNSEVTVSGKVTGVDADSFRLDYGSQYINVDISNLTNSDIKSELSEGDMVKVSGLVTDPWLADKQVIANNVTITKSESTPVEAIDRKTGEKTPGTLTTKEHIEYETRVEPNMKPGVITGEVVAINGRNLMIKNGTDTVTVDTMPLYVDPTGAYVFPPVEKGDSVQIQSLINDTTKAIEAQKLISIKKPYEKTAYEGQVLTAEGVRFVMATQTESTSE